MKQKTFGIFEIHHLKMPYRMHAFQKKVHIDLDFLTPLKLGWEGLKKDVKYPYLK